ncbi:MobC family plasmid mobilization relaxosome protein, partial [Clostridium butyricum]|uniref:MobC family plasmid mobilization relaxosome protein n=5 Tax=Clostridium butyricum TaxID=1492 RepID=UPI0034667586
CQQIELARGDSPLTPFWSNSKLLIFFTSEVIFLGRTKDKQFNFYVSEKDYNSINKKIEKSKLSKQDYLTKCALDKEIIVVEDLQKIFIELKRQGTNLNQIAKLINSGEINHVAENTLKEYAELWQSLRQLIQKVQ